MYHPNTGQFTDDVTVMYDIALHRECTRTREYMEKNHPETNLFPLPLPDIREEENGIPYIPGYLAFREVEIFCDLYSKLEEEPDVIIVDGNGRLHPRMAGLACHLGVMLNKPVIGVTKDFLPCGDWDRQRVKSCYDKLQEYGDYFEIKTGDNVYGVAWRTPTSKLPIFISVGNKIDIESAINIVSSLAFTRIPEPINTSASLARKARVIHDNLSRKK